MDIYYRIILLRLVICSACPVHKMIGYLSIKDIKIEK